MQQAVSKSQFKTHVLELLRDVEKKKQPVIITHAGKPVAKVVPYGEENIKETLRNTVSFYKDPHQPVTEKDWEALR